MIARDPGAQPERTILAWRRTALAAMVCLALLVHHARDAGGTGILTAGFAAASAACLLVAALVRAPRLREAAPPAAPRLLAVVAAVTTATTACGALSTLT